MTETREREALLVLRRQLLLEITDLIGQFGGSPQGLLSSPEYRRVLASVQRSCRIREQVFQADQVEEDLLPYLRQDITLLGRDAELLRWMLLDADLLGENGLPGVG